MKRVTWQGNEGGFTLLELVVVMALVSVVAIVAAEFLSSGAHLYTATNVHQELLQTSRIALYRMIREIAEADSVLSADASLFRFLDPDSTDITFALSGSQVVRNSDPLVDHVASLIYRYWDANGDSLATPVDTLSHIWRVGIALTVGYLDESVTLQSEVYPRNGHY